MTKTAHLHSVQPDMDAAMAIVGTLQPGIRCHILSVEVPKMEEIADSKMDESIEEEISD